MFIIAQIDQDTRKPVSFWSGSNYVEDLQLAKVYDSSEQVRIDVSDFQRADYNIEFRVLKVARQIEIAD